jgi:hypothetical protein
MNDPTKIELLEKLLKVLHTDRGMKFLLSLSDEDLKTLLVTVRE